MFNEKLMEKITKPGPDLDKVKVEYIIKQNEIKLAERGKPKVANHLDNYYGNQPELFSNGF